jgi:hypothetical protein
MSITIRQPRLFVVAGVITFAAASAAGQAAPPAPVSTRPTPHTVTCGDGTTDNSGVKSPCSGHGGVKKNAQPKPANVPTTAAASAAVSGTGTKITSPRDPATPTKILTPEAGGIGNTAVMKEGQVNKAAGGVGNTAVEKEGQMNKAAGGVGTTEVVKMAPGGVGTTQVIKGETAVKCKDGTYSKAEHAKDRCVANGGVASPGASKPTPTPP